MTILPRAKEAQRNGLRRGTGVRDSLTNEAANWQTECSDGILYPDNPSTGDTS